MIELKGDYRKCFDAFRSEFGITETFSINIEILADIANTLKIECSELKDKRGWLFINEDNEIIDYAKDDAECFKKNEELL